MSRSQRHRLDMQGYSSAMFKNPTWNPPIKKLFTNSSTTGPNVQDKRTTSIMGQVEDPSAIGLLRMDVPKDE